MSHRDTIAAFDFDGTITKKESLQYFLRYVLGDVGFASGVIKAVPALIRGRRSMIARQRAKERLLEKTIRGIHYDTLAYFAQQFVIHELPKIIRPEVMDRVNYHKALGHTLILVSASPSIYLKPWAAIHGFQVVLCSELEVVDNLYTGKLSTTNCWGPEKVHRLRQWWGKKQPDYMYAYGDSNGDIDMLSIANEQWYRGKKLDDDKKR